MKELKLSSGFLKYFGLIISFTLSISLLALWISFDDNLFLFFFVFTGAMFVSYLILPEVVVSKKSMTVSGWFRKPKEYNLTSVTRIHRNLTGYGIVTLSNGETIHFMPKHGLLFPFFNYEDYIKRRMKYLMEE